MGKVIQSFLKGFYTFLNSKRIWLFQYAVNLLFALLIAYPLKSLLTKYAGNSLTVDKALSKFNYTIVNDFLQNYGLGFDAIKSQSLLVFFLYFCLLVFFNAGIIHVVQRYPGSYKFRDFLAGGAEYFWRFFRLSIYFLLLYLLLAFIGFKIATLEGLSPFELENELGLISKGRIVLFVLPVLFFILSIIHDIIKVMITRSRDNWISRSVFTGLAFFKKHMFKFILLAIFQLLMLLLLMGAYYLFRRNTDSSSSIFIVLFLIGQLFILFKIGLKIWRLSSVYQLILRV